MIRRLIGNGILWFIDGARRSRASAALPSILFTTEIEDSICAGRPTHRDIAEILERARRHLAQAHPEVSALDETDGPHAPRRAS